LLRTLNWLVAFKAFTGGGGNMDLCDDSDDFSDSDDSAHEKSQKKEYEMRLRGARKKGLDVGSLTAKAISEWYNNGWYDLFYNR
jgi:hypothetical protein